MEKLELKEIVGYLPYGLKCQYEGILNGKELKAYRKFTEPKIVLYSYDYERFYKEFPIPEEINGLKIGNVKEVKIYKNYWKILAGIYNTGLKSFPHAIGCKPILRPLSDLTKEIEVDGEKFVPFDELKSYSFELNKDRKWSKVVLEDMPYSEVLKLYSWHFDIHNLINRGLAIDINEL